MKLTWKGCWEGQHWDAPSKQGDSTETVTVAGSNLASRSFMLADKSFIALCSILEKTIDFCTIWEDKRFSNYLMLVLFMRGIWLVASIPLNDSILSMLAQKCALHTITALLTSRFYIYWQNIQKHPSGEFSNRGWRKISWTRFRNPLVPCLLFRGSWVLSNRCHPASQSSATCGCESPSPPASTETFSRLCSFLLPFTPGRYNQNLEVFTGFPFNFQQLVFILGDEDEILMFSKHKPRS